MLQPRRSQRSPRAPSEEAERVHWLPQHNYAVDYVIILCDEAFLTPSDASGRGFRANINSPVIAI
jgi:hypothetical protein